MDKKSVLITGGNGFLGSALTSHLRRRYSSVKSSIRVQNTDKFTSDAVIEVGAINKSTNWDKALIGIDVIVHTAARVHIMDDSSSDPLDDFREVNTYGTLNLAQQAADTGVKRFIFISSIKVNGESTERLPFKANDSYIPTDPYGLSKYEAEVGLHKIAKETALEVVIIRPPLVYGPGVKANFATMMKWVNKGVPLPLGGITENKRSLVSVDNLVDLIAICIDNPNAANETFLVSDNDNVSTTGLLKKMAVALNVPSRLIPLPVSWFTFVAKLLGKPAISRRLCGSLHVDISKTTDLLNWTPPYAAEQSMKKTADAFLSNIKTDGAVASMAIRSIDVLMAVLGLIVTSPILFIVALIGYFDTGSPIFIQERVGRDKKPFKLIKFRTMPMDTKSVASHLANTVSITKLGRFLRKTKIDELPQLINVLKGEMSLVGPRPNLFNQKELINERDSRGVYDILPGITGLAQVNNIDMSTPKLLAQTDKKMMETLTIKNYFIYIFQTITGRGSGDAVN